MTKATCGCTTDDRATFALTKQGSNECRTDGRTGILTMSSFKYFSMACGTTRKALILIFTIKTNNYEAGVLNFGGNLIENLY